MAGLSPIDAVSSSGVAVGKYFAVTNAIPSSLLVLYVWALVSAGAWSGPMNFVGVQWAVRSLGLGDIAWFVAIVFAVSLAIHPLQFTFTQLLEGYWGSSRIGRWAAHHQTLRHHHEATELIQLRDQAYKSWVVAGARLWKSNQAFEWDAMSSDDRKKVEKQARRALARPSAEEILPAYLDHQIYARQLGTYPTRLYRIMPTRLGNALRRSEDEAGKQYGLDTLTIAPHLSLIADPNHYRFVEDRQTAMDLAISQTLTCALATAMTAVLLSDDGTWSLLTFVPFLGAYVSYLGAVAAARSYNVAIETVTDLSRFALYRALHVPLPKSAREEIETAGTLMQLLNGSEQPNLRFAESEITATPGPSPVLPVSSPPEVP